jgi:CHAT domain-containing protein
VVSSYTPTLTALVNARASWKSVNREELRALVVTETLPGAGFTNIPQAEHEARAVLDALRNASSNLIDHEGLDLSVGALSEPVVDKLARANVVHLACHGQQHPNDPLESGFRLRDGPLTVSKLMELKLPNALVAFLSACETAQGDKNHPDQVIHLAAAMLFTGFKSIVATMW